MFFIFLFSIFYLQERYLNNPGEHIISNFLVLFTQCKHDAGFLVIDWRDCFWWWRRYFVTSKEFSQAWRYWRTQGCQRAKSGFVVGSWLLSWNEWSIWLSMVRMRFCVIKQGAVSPSSLLSISEQIKWRLCRAKGTLSGVRKNTGTRSSQVDLEVSIVSPYTAQSTIISGPGTKLKIRITPI